LYLRDGKRSNMTETLPVSAPRLCLHSAEIELTHPLTGERIRFTSKADFAHEASTL
jgi:23S rRNA-/tRNA-specific pseudouridylate synthase